MNTICTILVYAAIVSGGDRPLVLEEQVVERPLPDCNRTIGGMTAFLEPISEPEDATGDLLACFTETGYADPACEAVMPGGILPADTETWRNW